MLSQDTYIHFSIAILNNAILVGPYIVSLTQ